MTQVSDQTIHVLFILLVALVVWEAMVTFSRIDRSDRKATASTLREVYGGIGHNVLMLAVGFGGGLLFAAAFGPFG